MTVLVGYATAHSATKRVAQEIADRLLKAGFQAVARPLHEVHATPQYQALILGSAIHEQAWLPEGATFLTEHANDLAKRPVWLFSVSSVGEASSVDNALAQATTVIHPRDHRHFFGAIERGQWGPIADLFLKVCGGGPGDYRHWADVDAWADGIARELHAADRVKERRRLHFMVRGKP